MQISKGLFKLRICKEFKSYDKYKENFYKKNIHLDQVLTKLSIIILQVFWILYIIAIRLISILYNIIHNIVLQTKFLLYFFILFFLWYIIFSDECSCYFYSCAFADCLEFFFFVSAFILTRLSYCSLYVQTTSRPDRQASQEPRSGPSRSARIGIVLYRLGC